jgi:hypothetical protein
MEDLKKYVDKFPYHVIPHVTKTSEINDIIHNYNNAGGKNALQKAKEQLENADKFIPPNERIPKDPKIPLDQKKPPIKYSDLDDAREDLMSDKTARLIGLICHLVYWNVFGHMNAVQLDTYHKKMLFIQIAQIHTEIDNKYAGKKIFTTFHMPMQLLCIRIMVDHIFRNTYHEFYAKE